MKKIICWLGLSVIILCFAGSAFGRDRVDNRIYALLLKKHVEGSAVNYDGFKKDAHLLDEYLTILSQTSARSLSRDDQFAYYINVYNAFTIKLVLTRYPGINSIKETGGFFSNPWSKKFITLEGKTLTLDHIEHKILRPRFKDPRVHFAINCASRSCPPLRNEPYEGKILEYQLNEQTKNFINDQKNTLIKDNTLFVSRIFKWFKEDFSGNPLLFIKQYAGTDLKHRLLSNEGKIKLSYLNYDWSLNR